MDHISKTVNRSKKVELTWENNDSERKSSAAPMQKYFHYYLHQCCMGGIIS